MKGEEDKLFDDFLRKSVGNYQVKPSPAVWKGLLQKVPARRIGRLPFSGGNSGLVGIISGGIIITSVAIYNHNSQKHHINEQSDSSGTLSAQNVPQKSTDTAEKSTYYFTTVNPEAVEEINKPSPEIINPLSPAEKIRADIMKETTDRGAATPVTSSFMDQSENFSDNNLKDDQHLDLQDILSPKQAGLPEETPVPLAMNNEKYEVLSDIRLVSTDKSYFYKMAVSLNRDNYVIHEQGNNLPRDFKTSRWKGDYFTENNNLSIGLFYHPEWLYNPGDSKYEEFRQNLGINISLKKRPFFIETGLGIMQEKAWQDYDVRFNKFLGTYNNLQYIIFDSVAGQLIPTYYYLTDSVYDPNEQQQQHSNLATYTYLQLPLLIGYEKSIGRSSFSFKTGPVFSILTNKMEDKLLIGSDQQIITIEGDHPERLKTSWQWHLGIGYSYALTDNINLFFEPAVRGYLNNPYERKRKSSQNPVFIGIRTGISFQFKNPFLP
ncbi:MAG: hypothetical protein AB9842_03515 [Bacteroidales bacterium]